MVSKMVMMWDVVVREMGRWEMGMDVDGGSWAVEGRYSWEGRGKGVAD